MLPSPNPWLARPLAAESPVLFCFAHAGAGAAVYRSWPVEIGGHTVCPVQLPGREWRFQEPPFTSLPALVRELGAVLLPFLDRPFAFFGHSLGGLIAFELARHLRRHHRVQPHHLVLSSAAPAERIAAKPTWHALDEGELAGVVKQLAGTEASVLDRPEILRTWLPLLRADLKLCETTPILEEPPLSCPFTLLGGAEDEVVLLDDLQSWRPWTRGICTLHLLRGGHFYLKESLADVLSLLGPALAASYTQTANESYPLPEDEIHLWYAALDLGEQRWFDPAHLLNAAEQKRAARYHFERERRRFATGRCLLRLLLGRYLNADPKAIEIIYGGLGKPELGGEWQHAGLHFNVAHSDELIVLGVTRGRALGVDVEKVRAQIDLQAMARRFFAPGEVVALQALPADQQRTGFFTIWTRKEAYLKARGTGLTEALDHFEVSLHETKPEPVRSLVPGEIPGRWHQYALTLPAGYLGAVCTDQPPRRLRTLAWWEAWPDYHTG